MGCHVWYPLSVLKLPNFPLSFSFTRPLPYLKPPLLSAGILGLLPYSLSTLPPSSLSIPSVLLFFGPSAVKVFSVRSNLLSCYSRGPPFHPCIDTIAS